MSKGNIQRAKWKRQLIHLQIHSYTKLKLCVEMRSSSMRKLLSVNLGTISVLNVLVIKQVLKMT